MFTLQVWFLVRDYLRFKTVSTLEEIPIVLFPPYSNVKIPTMTFCNLDPIRGDPPTDLNIPTMEDYLAKLHHVMKCVNCTESEKMLIGNVEVDLHEPHGYYQYIGREAARIIGELMEYFLFKKFLANYAAVQRKILQNGHFYMNTLKN